MPCVTFHIFSPGQSVQAHQWRVCYQRSLTRLILLPPNLKSKISSRKTKNTRNIQTEPDPHPQKNCLPTLLVSLSTECTTQKYYEYDLSKYTL